METLSQEPVVLNLSGTVGDDHAFGLTLVDVNNAIYNFTGFSARLQLRLKKSDTTPALSLTHLDGVTLSGGDPNIVIAISRARSTALGRGIWYYDLELTDLLGSARTWLSGTFNLKNDATR
jgi:hypothetical protein